MSVSLDLAGRYDIYGAIHKGLRRALGNLLVRLGIADFTPGAATERLLADLRTQLTLGAAHLDHEEQVIHTALATRLPGSTARLEAQHGHHAARFREIGALIEAVERAIGPARIFAGRDLYLAFSTFVAEDFAHMHEEETVTRPTLCTLFTDAEQAAMEMQIIGSLSPDENIAFMQLMLPAMNPDERAGLLGGMKAGAPPEAFAAVINFAARPTLTAEDFAELERRLAA